VIHALVTGDGASHPISNSAGAGPPICRSAQLSASVGLNGAAGTILGPVMISKTSGSACSLPDRRPRVLVTSGGKPTPINESARMPISGVAPPLERGAMTAVFVQWSNWCGKATTAMTLRFSHMLDITVPLVRTQPPCRSRSFGSVIAVTRPIRMR
jgi:hypothetical protein